MGNSYSCWYALCLSVLNCTINHKCFQTALVAGTVKQVDNNLLLPRRQPQQKPSFTNNVANPRTVYQAPSGTKRKPKHNSVFYDHAKNGFRYWYQERNKPMDRKY